MKTFNNYLDEAFDKVLSYRWIDPVIAKATLPNGKALLITFTDTNPNGNNDKVYEIEFSINHETSATGEGSQMQIFATVLRVISDFSKKHDPIGYTFSAEKFAKQRQDTRISLYKRLIKKFAPSIGMEASIDNEGWRTVFNLQRKKK
jgi:hypothetical protein